MIFLCLEMNENNERHLRDGLEIAMQIWMGFGNVNIWNVRRKPTSDAIVTTKIIVFKHGRWTEKLLA